MGLFKIKEEIELNLLEADHDDYLVECVIERIAGIRIEDAYKEIGRLLSSEEVRNIKDKTQRDVNEYLRGFNKNEKKNN